MQRRTVAAVVSLRVVARCSARRPAMAAMQAEGGRLSTRSMVRESADPIEVLYGSGNGESSGLLVFLCSLCES